MREVDEDDRPATTEEQRTLAAWSGWGAIPEVFDQSREDWATQRQELHALLSEGEYSAARRTVLNAHYTDPAYVSAIWQALGDLGFTEGRVLEPGSGAGTFIGLAPEGAQMTGVELDATTAGICQALYPQASIRAESFADTQLPGASFDATVGNVPFSATRLHDPRDNANRHSLHNHFILKSLRLTRPGGVVAVLSSHYTMDAANPAARREMNQMGELLGAVRLPTGAHRRTAGTEAITDVLIFRRREQGEPVRDRMWETVTPQVIDGQMVKINSYFHHHPEHVLGENSVGHGMYGSNSLHVRSEDLSAVAGHLRAALASITQDAITQDLGMSEPSPDHAPPASIDLPDRDQWDGSIHPLPDGAFAVSTPAGREPLKVPRSAAAELRALLELRDLATEQLARERANAEDSPEITTGREHLHARWRSYVNRYGPVNRYTQSPSGRFTVLDPGDTDLVEDQTVTRSTLEAANARAAAEGGRDAKVEEVLSRRTPTATRLLREDPFGPLVYALEVFDEESQEAQPASLLSQRVILPRTDPQGADTPAEALNLSLNRTGTADLEVIADLLGHTSTEAREALGTLVYDDPSTEGALVPAAEYLSGNVQDKLTAATEAASTDDRYAVNVRALRQVLPVPLTPEEITPKIGAVWISQDHHGQFLTELLADTQAQVINTKPGEWKVRGGVRHSLRAISEWGTKRRPAHDLFASLASQSEIKVTDKIEDGDKTREVLNPTETTAAQEKAEAIQERFSEWCWADAERAQDLAAEYNRRFNSIVLRDYTTAGDHLTLPGMAAGYAEELGDHQRAAVARMIAEPSVLLAHEVGAGKTREMVAGAMELRRLGMVNKPAVVVPNHMLEQFTREWLQTYPQARILTGNSENVKSERRRTFIARAAANEWDAVIITQEAFKRLSVDPRTRADYIAGDVEALREALESARTAKDRKTVKEIERSIEQREEQMKAALDTRRDPGITFEATGIDYLVVDEAHGYKNLATTSSIPEASIARRARKPGTRGTGSKTDDLAMKLDYLRRTHGGRVATFATATPIANSITEAHVMTRYLRPDLLRAAGVEAFDAWAATFGQTVSEVEMAPQGGFRMKTRFAKFKNVPEMLRMWHTFTDVKTGEDLNLPTPDLARRADGKRLPVTIAIPAAPEVLDYVADLGERADRVAAKAVPPEVDNMLKISTDGRKAALDMRMVDPTAQPASSPLDEVADNIARIHRDHQHEVFTDTRTGQPSPIPGALQLVFLDLGTPTGEGWNAYDELKDKLNTRGVPADGIRYIHEARNDRDKAALFSAAREGRIAVLMGSTQKMGVGTNVQARAVALHDVDCPWRPADVAQRHGRILRQGNQNPEVQILQYVTEGTFSAYMWQAIERKSRFINQIMRGRLDVREINDLGPDSLSAAEAKALASGNPLLLERSVALNEVGRLERLHRAWSRNQSLLTTTVQGSEHKINRLEETAGHLEAALGRVQDTSGDNFAMTFDQGQAHITERAAAGQRLATWAQRHRVHFLRSRADLGQAARLGGFTLTARFQTVGGLGNRDDGEIVFQLQGLPEEASVRIPRQKVLEGGIGLVTRLENLQASLPDRAARTRAGLAEARQTLEEARAQLGQPFKHADDLQAARNELARIDDELNQHANPDQNRPPGVQAATEPTAAETEPPARALEQWPPPIPGHAQPPTPEQLQLVREEWPATRAEAIELLEHGRQAMERAPYDPTPAQAYAAVVTEAHRRYGPDEHAPKRRQGTRRAEAVRLAADAASAVRSGAFREDRWWKGRTRREVKELIEATRIQMDQAEPGEDRDRAREIFADLRAEARRRYHLEPSAHTAQGPTATSPSGDRATGQAFTGPVAELTHALRSPTGPSM
ncbi:DEAD/DEAH box helicase family protein [Pseudactinotalea sp. Z1748]|uniref:DEAD/DEAH box helicase family protein n=1 Tax=Pseudactinotalea sp. Z1748 TaxID=3413027 RepID=UPI003C7DEB0C